ncbi:MAG: hypothetical protein ACYC5H_09995 [Methylovirgula sp.]
MVEESTAAAHALRSEMDQLTQLMAKFSFADVNTTTTRARQHPVLAAQAQLATALNRAR